MRRPQNLKKSPTLEGQNSWFYSVASKQVGDFFFQIFVAFSEKLIFIYLLFVLRRLKSVKINTKDIVI